MIEALESNALKAETEYTDTYVAVTGRLSVIDSDGKYISLSSHDDMFSFINVQCFITDDSQLNRVMELQTDDVVTVKGRITSVGELLGYHLDIDSIE